MYSWGSSFAACWMTSLPTVKRPTRRSCGKFAPACWRRWRPMPGTAHGMYGPGIRMGGSWAAMKAPHVKLICSASAGPYWVARCPNVPPKPWKAFWNAFTAPSWASPRCSRRPFPRTWTPDTSAVTSPAYGKTAGNIPTHCPGSSGPWPKWGRRILPGRWLAKRCPFTTATPRQRRNAIAWNPISPRGIFTPPRGSRAAEAGVPTPAAPPGCIPLFWSSCWDSKSKGQRSPCVPACPKHGTVLPLHCASGKPPGNLQSRRDVPFTTLDGEKSPEGQVELVEDGKIHEASFPLR